MWALCIIGDYWLVFLSAGLHSLHTVNKVVEGVIFYWVILSNILLSNIIKYFPNISSLNVDQNDMSSCWLDYTGWLTELSLMKRTDWGLTWGGGTSELAAGELETGVIWAWPGLSASTSSSQANIIMVQHHCQSVRVSPLSTLSPLPPLLGPRTNRNIYQITNQTITSRSQETSQQTTRREILLYLMPYF